MNHTLFFKINPSIKFPAWDSDSHYKFLFSKNLFHNLQNDFLKTTKLSMNLNDPDNLYFLCDECIVKY